MRHIRQSGIKNTKRDRQSRQYETDIFERITQNLMRYKEHNETHMTKCNKLIKTNKEERAIQT